ncbi:13493_t:CDS:2 [Cetraspora pellucida]|uniref:13493_t:CDS:1 n=1 Tax=Cetraspora pellucida TaxID=1433469 RepID=A0ACA9MKG6_9GLOM|nr:13493_t:CDS:2 [Cetraspora pellucida]
MDQANIPGFVNCTPSSFQNKILNKIDNTKSELDSNESISSSKFWTDSETKALLSFLSDNFDLYHKNKTKFYAAAAINIGNNRTSMQVNSKIQYLRTKYEKENKEETEKARSKWPYLDEINELFGNRKNVKPKYLISSIDNNKLNSLKKAKKESLSIAQGRLEIEHEKLR